MAKNAGSYCFSPFYYQRRKTREVKVGDVGVGANNPIRVQSMTISDTLNTEAVVKEAIGLIEAGCEIVRITAPTIHHAENLKNIRDQLRAKGYKTPLVADIHFTPQAAMIAAEYVEKVRINPGNFADRKLFNVREYTDVEYEDELKRIEEKFIPLVQKCKERGVAMRIGTNHGSLSDRIMNRYGDTALGMVESALEFLRIAKANDYNDIVLSMKASNPQVMVQAYRMLVDRMNQEGMDYPLHLGVTEAGEGEDGRIKSAVGILTLLEDGIGDTVRVSLTEDSIHEIPVAREMVRKFNEKGRSEALGVRRDFNFSSPLTSHSSLTWNPYEYTRHPNETLKAGPIHVGGKHVVRVVQSVNWPLETLQRKELEQNIEQLIHEDRVPEIISFDLSILSTEEVDEFLDYAKYLKNKFQDKVAVAADLQDAVYLFPQLLAGVDKVSLAPSREKSEQAWKAQAIEILRIAKQHSIALEWRLNDELIPTFASPLTLHPSQLLIQLASLTQKEGIERFGLCWAGSNWIYENRALIAELDEKKIEAVIHLCPTLETQDESAKMLEVSGKMGCLLLDGIGDSIEVPAPNFKASVNLAYNILQAARQRVTKTEFIACPSCGRTLFDLQTTTARIKKITSHLKGVKIAIMGCIVNGPGEMADADFGYVGGGPNKIHLYVGKECVEKNIPQEEADQRLVELIKQHGRWVEAPSV